VGAGSAGVSASEAGNVRTLMEVDLLMEDIVGRVG